MLQGHLRINFQAIFALAQKYKWHQGRVRVRLSWFF